MKLGESRLTLIDQKFFVPRRHVAVVDIGSGHEALCVRSVLENLGMAVTLHAIGTPGDLLQVLGQGDCAPPFLVLCGHGGDSGFMLGSYGPGIETAMLVDGCLPPASLAVALSDIVAGAVNVALLAGEVIATVGAVVIATVAVACVAAL